MTLEYTFNNFIGEETLEVEYKVPSLNFCGTMISDDRAIELIKSNEFKFNKAILNNIVKSMSYYFLKYFTAFMNSELTHAELLYGVNDFGNIVGFPYQGDFDINIVKKNINKLINETYIKTSVKYEDINDMYNIELIKVKYNYTIDNKHYDKFMKQQNINFKIMQEYYRRKKNNMNNLYMYSTKLMTIITDKKTQQELIDYIYNFLEYDDIMLFNNLKKKIRLGDYPINPSHELIQQFKEDRTTVYYWLTRFKDERMDFVRSLKPTRPTVNNSVYPNCLISMIEPMIPNWMNHNMNMNLYLIKISFYPNKIKYDDKTIHYKYDDNMIYCVRDVDCFGMPCCRPN